MSEINAKKVPMEECRGEQAPLGARVGDIANGCELTKFMTLNGIYVYLWVKIVEPK